jgi:hypothetical protein
MGQNTQFSNKNTPSYQGLLMAAYGASGLKGIVLLIQQLYSERHIVRTQIRNLNES